MNKEHVKGAADKAKGAVKDAAAQPLSYRLSGRGSFRRQK
jgi:hypothetical protein